MVEVNRTEGDALNPEKGIPVAIGETSARRHITGMMALNIPDSGNPDGGDWHEHASWFATVAERLQEHSLTNEEEYSELLDRLGRRGLRDARPGLAELGHPAGKRRSAIWAASHDRAIIELVWRDLRLTPRRNERLVGPPVDSLEVARWLGSPRQWIRLHWSAWRLRKLLPEEQRRRWDRWRKEWSPWA